MIVNTTNDSETKESSYQLNYIQTIYYSKRKRNKYCPQSLQQTSRVKIYIIKVTNIQQEENVTTEKTLHI